MFYSWVPTKLKLINQRNITCLQYLLRSRFQSPTDLIRKIIAETLSNFPHKLFPYNYARLPHLRRLVPARSVSLPVRLEHYKSIQRNKKTGQVTNQSL